MNGKIMIIKNAAIANRIGMVMNGKKLIVYSRFILYTFKLAAGKGLSTGKN